MRFPSIHLNGTSKRELISQLNEASHALNNAYSALKQAAPHGRDYYPQGPTALETAITEHMDRLRRLDAIKEEIDAMTLTIDQID